MPICKKCNKRFPNFITIDKKPRNLQRRKYCLECSPFGQHNTLPLDRESFNNDKRRIDINSEIKNYGDTCQCKKCGKVYIKTKSNNKLNNICSSCNVNGRRFKQREKLINSKGGCCNLCGYNKCYDALHFHHVDPATKEFVIAGNHARAWELLIKEVDKCVLVCANCHAEIHAGLISQDKIAPLV